MVKTWQEKQEKAWQEIQGCHKERLYIYIYIYLFIYLFIYLCGSGSASSHTRGLKNDSCLIGSKDSIQKLTPLPADTSVNFEYLSRKLIKWH
jgi:hypothetical protein